jgi:hypothetical protein
MQWDLVGNSSAEFPSIADTIPVDEPMTSEPAASYFTLTAFCQGNLEPRSQLISWNLWEQGLIRASPV